MNKKTITLILTTLLAVMGVKAEVIPSKYYSTVTAGTFYLYNVTRQQFLTGSPSMSSSPVALTLAVVDETKYSISPATDHYLKMGKSGSQYLWNNSWTNNGFFKWTFSSDDEKTYNLNITATANADNYFTNGVTYYFNTVNTAPSTAADEADEWALITEANYYSYIASTTATIPASFYTTTITAGTYYLYNTYTNCFLCDGNNYAGLSSTPETITITATGDNYYIQVSDGGYLHYSDQGKDLGNTWADNTSDQTWNFESFHGATGLFTVKNVTNSLYLYANSPGPANKKGAQLWGTVDSNKYAWALISEENYTAWQNSFVLDEATGYTATSDVYNVNPTVKRTMTANVWNTLVVPFNMAIPSGWTVMEPTAFDGSTLTFGDASSIVAGKPYIVKPTEAVTSFSATGVTLKKGLDPTTVGSGTTVTMTGTYEQIAAIDYSTQDSYIIGIKNGNSSLYKVNSIVTLKPFRAYFTIPGGKSNARITLNFDDETTGINVLETESTNDNASLKDGKYFQNGKIVIVKNGVKYSTNGQIAK